jgi:probable F420-dependent oxidoreductase
LAKSGHGDDDRGMKFAITAFLTDRSISPVDLAREVEARGFESLWIPEHSHIPTSLQTPLGGVKGGPSPPEHYKRTLDQLVSLAAMAAVTAKLRLGTGITLVAQRDPIWLAKEIATLDLISSGRVIFGIGYGWNKEEMASHGVPYEHRRAIVAEKIAAMKALWTEEEPSFHGRFVNFEPSWAWPKPVQKPHPPIILGAAAGPKTIGDIVSFADGWIPLGTRHEIGGKVDEVRSAVAAAGRDPSKFEITQFYVKPDMETLQRLTGWGIDRAIFSLPPKPAEDVIPLLDRLTELVAAYRA